MAPTKELVRTRSEPSFASGRGTAALAPQFSRFGGLTGNAETTSRRTTKPGGGTL